MAEDLPAEQILKQISERLDLLERVLATNTARLHDLEKHLGMKNQQELIAELFATEKSRAKGTRSPNRCARGSSQTSGLTLFGNTADSRASDPLRTNLPSNRGPRRNLRSNRGYGLRLNRRSRPRRLLRLQAIRRWRKVPHTRSTRAADAPFTLHAQDEAPAAEGRAVRAETVREEKRRDLESIVGGSWFNWIGIIAVTFGVAFFLKYAFDKQWIGPAGRVSLAALVGIGLLYLGERLRRRGLRSYAYVISGGGVLILYLSIFAAYNFYHLIGQPTAFVLMAAVTTTAVLLSVRLNALPVAFLGLVGGFLTPLLLSTGVDNQVGLFTYIALLDAGVLAVAYFKRWRSLDFASFAGTVAMTLGWAIQVLRTRQGLDHTLLPQRLLPALLAAGDLPQRTASATHALVRRVARHGKRHILFWL